jgi:hypothetical protein
MFALRYAYIQIVIYAPKLSPLYETGAAHEVPEEKSLRGITIFGCRLSAC